MMDTLEAFKEIAPYLSHPLVLIGFAILLFFGIHRSLIKAGIIPPLSPRTGGNVVQLLLRVTGQSRPLLPGQCEV